jgi:hemerythrin
MAIQWTADLAVGIAALDDQHKELFKTVDKLLSAMKAGRGRDEIGNIIAFLENYTVKHFGNEEQAMKLYGYPEFKDHKALHDQFIKEFEQLKKGFSSNGAGTSLAIQVQKQVVDWLKNHISKVDKALGGFMIARM